MDLSAKLLETIHKNSLLPPSLQKKLSTILPLLNQAQREGLTQTFNIFEQKKKEVTQSKEKGEKSILDEYITIINWIKNVAYKDLIRQYKRFIEKREQSYSKEFLKQIENS